MSFDEGCTKEELQRLHRENLRVMTVILLITGLMSLFVGISLFRKSPVLTPKWQQEFSHLLATPIIGQILGIIYYNPLFDIVLGNILISLALLMVVKYWKELVR